MRTLRFGIQKTILFLALFASTSMVMAQSDSASATVPTEPEAPEWNIRPKLSIGVGMLNYQGDLVAPKGYFNPFQNKAAIHINAAQQVSDFLDLNFYMIYGTLGADERMLTRNLNFRSRLTTGGVAVSYNFSHLLKPDHILEPYVSLGVEAFEFQSGTDLYDRYGNPYHYWSDGTIRNMPESKENITEAIEITRDYQYETDIREYNADGFGDYSQRSFAIPVGAGFNFKMNPKIDFKMGIEQHITFSDYIDGITVESRGVRQGNKQNDKFLHTFARLSYDLTPTPHEIGEDARANDKEDSDQDSIPDFLDDCPATPAGVQVNSKGCPFDTDEDGVADYMDSELNSPPGSIVDSLGVAMDATDFERMFLEFRDSKGKYAVYTNETYSLETVERKTQRKKTSYSVKIGEFEEGVNDSLANVLLSNPDVTMRQEGNKTVIEVGNFDNLPDAIQRKVDLESKGIATSDVMETKAGGSSARVTNIEQDAVYKEKSGITVEEAIAKNKSLPAPKKLIVDRGSYTLDRPIDERSVTAANDQSFGEQTVYRVQVGAFANKLSNDVFAGTKDLLVVTTEDGLTRYYVGAFTTYDQAAARKIDMIEQGFEGAYIAPFKNGKRISTNDVGATPADNVVPIDRSSSSNYGKVKFKIQIAAYGGQVPTDMLDKMMDLDKIDQRKTEDGKTRYITGEFNTYEEANAYKEQLISRGFEGAFTVAEIEGRIISAQEGLELLK